MDKARIGARVSELAELIGLGATLDRQPGQLSGGQQGGPVAAEPKVHFGRGQTSIDWRQRMVAIPT
jgi:predicted ABC-type transport system involved in lysophospholipase L1 biosynthesis ATPase subunit